MKIKNPIFNRNVGSRDPFIVEHKGFLYSCYDARQNVVIKKFKSLTDIENAEEKETLPPNAHNLVNWYAPEMHLIDGHWYVYSAPCDKTEYDEVKKINPLGEPLHTMQVLRSATDDPFSDWEYMGVVGGLEGKWSIDGTVIHYQNKLYMALDFQGIHICEMDGPLKLKGEPKLLSRPDYDWEKVMTPINEGPAPLYKDGKIHLAFSASDSHSDGYCLGLLSFNGGDILDKSNWVKHPAPLLQSSNGFYGPGHCSFLRLDGKDLIVYHANTQKNSGRGGSYMFAQAFSWKDGLPVIGEIAAEFEI